MSKRESIIRYNLIIKLIKRKPSTFEEISEYLRKESDLHSYDFNISKRTFQRDLADIREIYNIDIQYHFTRKVYYMNFEQSPEFNSRLLEAFDTFNALNVSESISQFVHLEKREPQGTENLYGLLHAIRNRYTISFVYQKFWNDERSVRKIDPYALKEFRNRWYVMGKDHDKGQIKSFGLDRLTDLEIFKTHFDEPLNFDIQSHFKYCFGITTPNSHEPDEIILSLTPLQGKYVKTLPLHESQEVILDSRDEVKVRLRVFITHEFLMELLSYGDSVKVIKPKHLAEELMSTYESALRQYS